MLIFSDMHYGISNNDIKRLDDTDNCLDWIISTAVSRNEKLCVFAGDWCHARDEINVMTMLRAKKAIEKLAKHFRVIVAAGNHDFYENNNREISSLDIFNNIGNVTFVKTEPYIFDYEGVKVAVTPWGHIPSENEKYDVVIGHYEYNGAKTVGKSESKAKFGIKELLQMSPLVFTGHYHLTGEHERVNGAKVISIGSPYQQDWGDSGDNKRIIFFDGKKYDSIYNTVSPQFVKISYDKISMYNDSGELNKVFSHPSVMNSFVKIIVEKSVEYDKLREILNIGRNLNTRNLEAEYMVDSIAMGESINKEMENKNKKPLFEYVHEFVDIALKDDKFKALNHTKIHQMIDNYSVKVQS